ncbi:triphosphoribosyl-dephospho-CoA synthase [bacterium]|nr:triphosphoribosyl-dephospho-CoA synthase [bacterium]
MLDPLQPYRQLCTTPSEAIRWACILEATAPKVGNVFPGQSFEDLSYIDFIAAAEITSNCFIHSELRISQRMLDSVTQVQAQQGTNVNLGIVLLLGPIVAADEAMHEVKTTSETSSEASSEIPEFSAWLSPISRSLSRLDEVDGANIYTAIQKATAGALGTSEQLDVNQAHESIDIREAMSVAKDRDQIAQQYNVEFRDLILNITPILFNSIQSAKDILTGICHAQIHLLTRAPDTLIARKNGMQVACEVQTRAKSVNPNNVAHLDSFDHYLRSKGHKLNPGTTADLLAASLYLLLRTNPSENNHE